MSWVEICNSWLNHLDESHFPHARNAVFKEEIDLRMKEFKAIDTWYQDAAKSEESISEISAGYSEMSDPFVIFELAKYQKHVNEITDINVKLLAIVKRAANNSCCICCDECLGCDAQDLLKELGEEK